MDVTVVTATLMLIFRYQLMISETYPEGRFYPYAGIGGTRANVDISESSDTAQGMISSDLGGLSYHF